MFCLIWARRHLRYIIELRERALQADIAEYTKALASTQRMLEDKTKKLQEAATSLKDVQANNAALR